MGRPPASEVAAGSELIVGIVGTTAPAGATNPHRTAPHARAPSMLRVLIQAAVLQHPRPRWAAVAANLEGIAGTAALMALGGAISQRQIVRNALAASIQVAHLRAAVGLRLRHSHRPVLLQDPHHLPRQDRRSNSTEHSE